MAITHVPVQRAFVRAFDAALADVRGRGVIAAVDPLEILEADAADVADRVRARLAERIVARERLLDVDAREAMPAHGERCGLLLGEVAELHTLEAAMGAHEVAQRLVLARIDEAERLELLQRLVEALDFLRDRDELPAREIVRDHDAVAIVDEPARRRQRLEPEAVALRELGEALVVDDLENDEPRDEQPGEEHDDHRGRDDPGQEQLLLLPVILEACRP